MFHLEIERWLPGSVSVETFSRAHFKGTLTEIIEFRWWRFRHKAKRPQRDFEAACWWNWLEKNQIPYSHAIMMILLKWIQHSHYFVIIMWIKLVEICCLHNERNHKRRLKMQSLLHLEDAWLCNDFPFEKLIWNSYVASSSDILPFCQLENRMRWWFSIVFRTQGLGMVGNGNMLESRSHTDASLCNVDFLTFSLTRSIKWWLKCSTSFVGRCLPEWIQLKQRK